MFKVGDYVTLKKQYEGEYESVQVGGRYKVTKIDKDCVELFDERLQDYCGKKIIESFHGYPYPINDLLKIRSSPVTETDFLDAIQENFREGV